MAHPASSSEPHAASRTASNKDIHNVDPLLSINRNRRRSHCRHYLTRKYAGEGWTLLAWLAERTFSRPALRKHHIHHVQSLNSLRVSIRYCNYNENWRECMPPARGYLRSIRHCREWPQPPPRYQSETCDSPHRKEKGTAIAYTCRQQL